MKVSFPFEGMRLQQQSRHGASSIQAAVASPLCIPVPAGGTYQLILKQNFTEREVKQVISRRM